MARLRYFDIYRANYLLNYWGINNMSCQLLGRILGLHQTLVGQIFRGLGWERTIERTMTQHGYASVLTMYHRNGSYFSDHTHGYVRALARKKLSRQLGITEEELKEYD